MKLIKREDQNINIGELKDGEIAIITKWVTTSYLGEFVQRFNNRLIALGKPCTESWGDFYEKESSWQFDGTHEVRRLKSGDLIEIE